MEVIMNEQDSNVTWFYIKPHHTKQAGSDWAGLLDQLQPDTSHATTPQHLHLLQKPHHR